MKILQIREKEKVLENILILENKRLEKKEKNTKSLKEIDVFIRRKQ